MAWRCSAPSNEGLVQNLAVCLVSCLIVEQCVAKLSEWQCSGGDNAELITNLEQAGIIQHGLVKEAMLGTDRGIYVPDDGTSYQDSPQRIGFGVTISAPHMHAHALEMMYDYLQPGMKALDVGSGSGYLVSCMARMVGPNGSVHGVELVKPLVERSIQALNRDDPQLLGSGRVTIEAGDGYKGLAKYGPFNAIHVGAAAPTIPEALVEQLVIPVGPQDGDQYMMQIDKDASGKVTKKNLMGVRYVPLIPGEQYKQPK